MNKVSFKDAFLEHVFIENNRVLVSNRDRELFLPDLLYDLLYSTNSNNIIVKTLTVYGAIEQTQTQIIRRNQKVTDIPDVSNLEHKIKKLDQEYAKKQIILKMLIICESDGKVLYKHLPNKSL